ncbi:MAG TPA: NAD-dependent succinate-semialdehyde dehydrogenase [Bacillus sp. (in: firmicutes)]|uniref:NAD-dependent succinate-semialdehyde dehydrogenase n=1 Tax=Bacillus litorisediminis TaxID=2922713 RepID=UPI002435246A|nr:NAD-dependent succinate-semialdehyde dehydrogenase [Bacillus litorisediminis]HWO76133.1 NAD-dependent succinate-semialdehyde dehydrogenase [Bacillus sp. (in: firmicutes)]
MEKKMYIGGQWVHSVTEKTSNVTNPATEEVIGVVPSASREDAAIAIDAANEVFESWSKTTASERCNYLFKTSELLIERADEIAEILTLEQGKPFAEAKGEVLFAAEYFRLYSEEAKRIYGETIPAPTPNKRLLVIRQPIGVVAAITPWNFPALMIARKIGPALAAGCPVVVKPAEQTPLTAIAIFETFEKAGFPAGVVNLVTGKGSRLGPEFLENQKVKKITFTGSTEVGKYLAKGSADQMKRISLELGGHAPFIVFEDADLDKAVEACIISKFRNAGQTCICSNRIYVQDSIMKAFSDKLAERVQSLKLGNGFEKGVDIGPLIDRNALEKVQEHVEDALNKGAKLVTGGSVWNRDGLAGSFFAPTILTNVDDSMLICHEETFGPVAPLLSFSTEEEVIKKANNSSYGLASYVFTRDLGKAFRVSENLEYGMVGVNDPLPTVAQSLFIGWKESGLGYEGGKYGMDQYLEMKYISMVLND